MARSTYIALPHPPSSTLLVFDCLEPCVEDCDDLSRGCGDCDDGLLSVGDEAVVEVCEFASSACGLEGWQEEDGAQLRPSAAHSAVSDPCSALVGVGGKACEGGGLSPVQGTQLGHEGEQGGGGDVADAGHCGEDCVPCAHAGLADELADLGLEEADPAGDGGEHVAVGGGQLRGARGLCAGPPRDLHGQQIGAAGNEAAQPFPVGVRGLPEGEVLPALAPVACHEAGVDGVALAEAAMGADEGL